MLEIAITDERDRDWELIVEPKEHGGHTYFVIKSADCQCVTFQGRVKWVDVNPLHVFKYVSESKFLNYCDEAYEDYISNLKEDYVDQEDR